MMLKTGTLLWCALISYLFLWSRAALVQGLEGSLKYQVLRVDEAPDYRSSSRRADFFGTASSERKSEKSSDQSRAAESSSSEGLFANVWHRYSPNSPFLPKNATRTSLMKESSLRDQQRIAMIAGQIELASRDLTLSDLSIPQDDVASVQAAMRESLSSDSGPSAAHLVSPVVSGLSLGSGEYFARFQVGTPGVPTYLVMDTGSDVLWLQCSPCKSCYPQHGTVFAPSNSSSYRTVPCSAGWCSNLDVPGCSKGKCLYQVSYGDGSFTVGDLSVESFTLGASKGGDEVVQNVPFGCGHDNEGLFVGAGGILGLGKGSLSFPNQLASPYAKKFSYCMVNRDTGDENPSSLIFGDAAVPAGVKYTPQVANAKIPSFYYVSLTGVSVGGTLVAIPEATFALETTTGKGGVIIDSGTSITWLKEAGYNFIRDAFRAGTAHLPRSSASFKLFDTCYDLSNYTSVDVPTLTLHFEGGAEMDLPAHNYVIPVDDGGKYCLALAPSSSNFSIIGNVQQQNFRVVYDNVNSRIGFVPGQCN